MALWLHRFSRAWRIIPAGNWLVTPHLYAPFRLFGRGPTTRSLRDWPTMVINPLLTGGATWAPIDAPENCGVWDLLELNCFDCKVPPLENLTWHWKIHHEWRCISYWTWGICQCHVSFQGCKWDGDFDVYSESRWIHWIWGVKKRQRSPPQPRLRQRTRQRRLAQPQLQPRIAMRLKSGFFFISDLTNLQDFHLFL